jgi:hypothetical protein
MWVVMKGLECDYGGYIIGTGACQWFAEVISGSDFTHENRVSQPLVTLRPGPLTTPTTLQQVQPDSPCRRWSGMVAAHLL